MDSATISHPDIAVQVPERRADSRESMSVEIVLRGTDRWGKGFVEKTRTVNISRTGAKTRTEHAVSPGSRLRVAIPHLERTSWGTVVWVGEKAGNLQEIGIAIDETSDFWGVQLSEDQPDNQAVETTDTEEMAKPQEVTPDPAPPARPVSVAPAESIPESLPVPREAGLESSSKLSNALNELVQGAIEQNVRESLRQLHKQTTEIMKDMQEVIARETQERVRQSVETALQQVEAAALDLIRRNQSARQPKIKTPTDSAILGKSTNTKGR